MKFYLDACCLNRPFDDQRQVRVRLEAEAVLAILGRVTSHGWRCLTSEALEFEVDQIPDPQRRQRVRTLLLSAAVHEARLSLDEKLQARANQLETLGFKPFDALHVAGAEQAAADAFLTTDD